MWLSRKNEQNVDKKRTKCRVGAKNVAKLCPKGKEFCRNDTFFAVWKIKPLTKFLSYVIIEYL